MSKTMIKLDKLNFKFEFKNSVLNLIKEFIFVDKSVEENWCECVDNSLRVLKWSELVKVFCFGIFQPNICNSCSHSKCLWWFTRKILHSEAKFSFKILNFIVPTKSNNSFNLLFFFFFKQKLHEMKEKAPKIDLHVIRWYFHIESIHLRRKLWFWGFVSCSKCC